MYVYAHIHVRMYICTYERVCVCNTINMRIYNKINMRIYQLGKMWKCINSYSYKYKQMILPLFDYADFMIGCSHKSKVDMLEKLQERAIRYVENDLYYNMAIDVYCIASIMCKDFLCDIENILLAV